MYMHNTIVHHNVQKSNLLMSQLSNCTSTNQALDIMNNEQAQRNRASQSGQMNVYD